MPLPDSRLANLDPATPRRKTAASDEWRAGVRIELDALSKAFAAESSRWLLRRESGNPSTLSSKNALAPLGSQDQPR